MQSIRCIYFISTIEYLPLAGYVGGVGEKADMPMATDYRKRAQECMEIAQTVRTSTQRTMLLHIAETWLRLANDAEGNSPKEAAARDSGRAASLN
jgi:hypothetical protein